LVKQSQVHAQVLTLELRLCYVTLYSGQEVLVNDTMANSTAIDHI